MEPRDLPPGDWSPLAVHASARRYFRGLWEGRPALLAHFGDDADGLARFVAATRLFTGRGIPVPALLASDPARSFVVQEFVEGPLASRVRWGRGLEGRIFALAAAVATVPPEAWPDSPPLLELDAARLRFELGFFDLHFVQGFLNRAPDRLLRGGLDALAEAVAAHPRAMAHRDFHSENVILSGEGPVLVDYQDALLAPRSYDLASLAVDAYRRQPGGFRARCLAASGVEAGEFRAAALQRALKALGTFGYQVTRRKNPRYLTFIRTTVPHARALLDAGGEGLAALVPVLEEAERL